MNITSTIRLRDISCLRLIAFPGPLICFRVRFENIQHFRRTVVSKTSPNAILLTISRCSTHIGIYHMIIPDLGFFSKFIIMTEEKPFLLFIELTLQKC